MVRKWVARHAVVHALWRVRVFIEGTQVPHPPLEDTVSPYLIASVARLTLSP